MTGAVDAAVGQLTYLACPYSHPDRSLRIARFRAANRAAAHLMLAGHHVYSPISHTHPIADAGDLPPGWEFWEKYDRIFIGMSKRVIVLKLDGYKESRGVNAEIGIALALGIPIEWMEPLRAR